MTVNELHVDRMVVCCAPRPILISSGTLKKRDGWVGAKGMFLAGVGAGPVYGLLGKKDLGAGEFPPVETDLIDGEVAFRRHSEGHATGSNWPTFLEFGERYFESATGNR